MILSIDLETFSSVDLEKSGLYKYVQAPDFQILLFAYAFDDEPVQIIDLAQGEPLPADVVVALHNPEIEKHAYNAPFEWYCLNKFYYSPLEQWRCTMLHGLYCGYPGNLAALGDALGLPQNKRKLNTGYALIRTFCIPCKPTKSNGHRTRTLPHHEPEKWHLFKEYCKQDVEAERTIERLLSSQPMPEQEQALWIVDQQINAFGVAVDRAMIDGALYCSETITKELTDEAISISGLDNPKSVQQLSKWLEEETGEEIANLQKATVKDLLNDINSEAAKRMLEIRQELSKTSVKKYDAMRNASGADDRIRGLLQIYGANRTGRWAGRLVQVQNLPKNHMDTLALARDLVRTKKLDTLKMIYGNVPDTLSQLIRTAFVPSPGNVLAVADFSAIEARVIAWLAGEQWRLDVFASHGKIYEASASAMFGVPIEKIVKGQPEYDLRQKGKIAELALGYQGSTGALITMGALDQGLTEGELPDIVRRWRAANKRIVGLWYMIENTAIEVVQTRRALGLKGLIFAMEENHRHQCLTVLLPSGRKLFFVQPFLLPNRWGNDSVHYWGMDQTTKKWTTLETYGGKLVENIVQAIARDCLAESIMRVSAAGYQTVMHVHDELIIDVPEEAANIEKICDIMGQPIPWAPGLLLKADGFTSTFYKKD
jgi:DNA polymerase